MALRRGEKNVRKFNRTNFRRSRGRTAEFFDLRESDDKSSTNEKKESYSGQNIDTGYSDLYGAGSGTINDTARPYRERHRVEVTSKDSRNDRIGTSGGADSDEISSLYRDGQNRENRIVRGNAPGSRAAKAVTTERKTDRKEIASDLLYSSEGRTRNSRTAGRPIDAGRTASYSGIGDSASRTGSSVERNGGRTASYSRYGRSTSRTGGSGSRYSSFDNELPRNDLREEEPEYDDFEFDGLYDETDYSGEDDDYREEHGRRMRRSERARRIREQQIRGFYLRVGIGAAVLIALMILVVPRIVSGIRSPKNHGETLEQGEAEAVAQENMDLQAEKDVTADADVTDVTADADGTDVTDAAVQDGSGTQEEEKGSSLENVSTAQADSDTEESEADAAQGDAGDAGTAQTDTDSEQGAAGQPDTEETADAATEEENTDKQGQTMSGETTDGTEEDLPAEQIGTLSGESDAASRTDAAAASGADLRTAAESGRYARQDDWRFILVNPWYKLPEEFEQVTTSSLPSGESVDSRCYDELLQMLDDCSAAGGQPIVCSSYRPHEKQVGLYEEEVSELMSSGMTREAAEAEAGTVVALPGTSEHELGLAVDICDYKNQNLDESQAETATQKWLMQHSWEYGFILRYPQAKSDLTGIIFEPWHYRYVGREAAEEITKKGLCLEEYLEQQ